MAMADLYTMETTYRLQFEQPDGSWQFDSQVEYETEAEVHQMAGQMYGGQCTYRVVRITREVVDN